MHLNIYDNRHWNYNENKWFEPHEYDPTVRYNIGVDKAVDEDGDDINVDNDDSEGESKKGKVTPKTKILRG